MGVLVFLLFADWALVLVGCLEGVAEVETGAARTSLAFARALRLITLWT